MLGWEDIAQNIWDSFFQAKRTQAEPFLSSKALNSVTCSHPGQTSSLGAPRGLGASQALPCFPHQGLTVLPLPEELSTSTQV